MLIVYGHDETHERVTVLTIHHARSSRAPAGPQAAPS